MCEDTVIITAVIIIILILAQFLVIMVTVSRSMDSKGALEHIISVLLFYDLSVKDRLIASGAYYSYDLMELTAFDFQQD